VCRHRRLFHRRQCLCLPHSHKLHLCTTPTALTRLTRATTPRTGECDDGSSGAEHDVCPSGADCSKCSDCGVYSALPPPSPSPLPPLSPPSPLPHPPVSPDGLTCLDTSFYAGSGTCSDVGPGCRGARGYCELGSDFINCGPVPRVPSRASAPGLAAAYAAGQPRRCLHQSRRLRRRPTQTLPKLANTCK